MARGDDYNYNNRRQTMTATIEILDDVNDHGTAKILLDMVQHD